MTTFDNITPNNIRSTLKSLLMPRLEKEHCTPSKIVDITVELLTVLDLISYRDEREDKEVVTYKERPVQNPAVAIEDSIQPDYIVCLENGQRFKMMRRHLREVYGMTPDDYRNKWGLPSDYPMAAPNFSASKSETARRGNLGKHKRKGSPKNGGATQH